MTVSRRRTALSVACAVLLVGSVGFNAATGSTPAAPSDLTRAACSLTPEELLRIWRGTRQDWSGDIQIVPREPNFVNGGLSHAGPWNYLQKIPMLWYGPGYIPPVGVVKRPVTLSDIAPTEAGLLNFSQFQAPDGSAMTEALPRSDAGNPPPRLIVTLVWDSGGRDVLNQWPRSWPYLHSLIKRGAWYSRATVGSSPSNTPPGHSQIGTGAFPRHNGTLDEFIRVGGSIEKPNQRGQAYLLVPTLADLYDRAMGNRPVVGEVATLSAHDGMVGHGSMWGGGDKDLLVNKENLGDQGDEGVTWNVSPKMAPWFDFPAYVRKLPPLSTYFHQADALDGTVDGSWRGLRFDDPRSRLGFDTPARIPYQTTLIKALIKREGFGANSVPDLLFINYKAIDEIGHRFGANGVQMRDTVQVQDEALHQLVSFLNKQVGRKRWAMVMTADHGTQYEPDYSGAWPIDVDHTAAVLEQKFGGGPGGPALVEKIRPTQIWVNTTELHKNGYTLEDVSQYILSLTESQTSKPAISPAPGDGRKTVFQAAFPTSLLQHLPCLPATKT